MYVCNRGDFLNQDGLREEARSIPFARSAASNRNHTWQPVLDVFLTTLHELCSHAMRDTAVGVWFACFGQVSGSTLPPGSRPAPWAPPSLTTG